jgi:hypothetical protein
MEMSLVTEFVLDVFKFQLQITRIVKYKLFLELCVLYSVMIH